MPADSSTIAKLHAKILGLAICNKPLNYGRTADEDFKTLCDLLLCAALPVVEILCVVEGVVPEFVGSRQR